ncbi:bifunctional Signal recognition particle subunit SRP68/Signal recognition particle subunit SRP68 [Babesia duncani]|uniref:Signal recognition particle subunit SRP68 n=1 Tax=Babesia duncani TaxID=323732 RepID=A0AAD9PKB1_9APIC|nr:bifunctional Signal recognition particle subunit SRP68/Signal recognition particle subunit SRP68 [Babesia duncani]
MIAHLPVLDFINEKRQRHGIKTEEYGRYHKYCSKRLGILRKQLRPANIKMYKYSKEPYPTLVTDVRHFEILLFLVERCWAHAMYLKLKYEHSSCSNKHGHRYFIRKFLRAWQLSRRLLKACEDFGNCNTCNNAKIYENYIHGVYQLECGDFQGAHSNLTTFASILNQKQRSSTSNDYTLQLSHLNSLIKYCTIHLRAKGGQITLQSHSMDIEPSESNLNLLVLERTSDGNLTAHYNGQNLQIESQILLDQIHKVLGQVDRLIPTKEHLAIALQAEIHKLLGSVDLESILELYDEILIGFSTAMDSIQHEQMAQAQEQMQLQRLHYAVATLRHYVEIEKQTLVLLHFLFRVSSNDSAQAPNCAEGLRHARILKQQLSSLSKDPACSSTLQIPIEIAKMANALIVGIGYLGCGVKQYPKALALISWSHSRDFLQLDINPLDPSLVRWRCLAMFNLLRLVTSVLSSRMHKRAMALFARSTMEPSIALNPEQDMLTRMGVVHQALPCKSLVFDLGFMEHGPPSLTTGALRGVKDMFASFFKK